MTVQLYAEPRDVGDLGECWFYHTMEIPGHGLVTGQWDLRGSEHRYTGGVDFEGRRVLEVGTASGLLCFYMERQGAEVVAFDLSDDHQWDLVPFAGVDADAEMAVRRGLIRKINNAYWLGHRAFGSGAKVVYGSVYDIPIEIGPVDIAIYGSVLLHVRDPFLALYNGLRLARSTVVVTDLVNQRRMTAADPAAAGSDGSAASTRSEGLRTVTRKVARRVRSGDARHVAGSYLRRYWRPQDLRGMPVMEFVPEFQRGGPLDSWWYLTPEAVQQFVGVLGFEDTEVQLHTQKSSEGDQELFTVVGHRTKGTAVGE